MLLLVGYPPDISTSDSFSSKAKHPSTPPRALLTPPATSLHLKHSETGGPSFPSRELTASPQSDQLCNVTSTSTGKGRQFPNTQTEIQQALKCPKLQLGSTLGGCCGQAVWHYQFKKQDSVLKTDGFLDDKTGQEPSSWKETSCPHNEKGQPGTRGEAFVKSCHPPFWLGWRLLPAPALSQHGRISPQTKEALKCSLTKPVGGFKKCKAPLKILNKSCTACSAGSTEKPRLYILYKNIL